MPFYNRNKEINQLKAILSGEPNLVYFVYGPINSGKTALLTKVFEDLSDDYIVFYFNFRGLNIREVDDLIRVLFEVEYGRGKEAVKEIVKELLNKGVKNIIEEARGIPIPEKLFDYLFGGEKKSEDVFRYLEQLFRELIGNGKKPVFVLDEIQSIRGIINAAGKPIIEGLFNFMVRLTKETHLCHSLCSTSDCLFIEEIYNNARLEGRIGYVLVDDLDKERAFEIYDKFVFKSKEIVWEYIGGKLGDMIRLYEGKKQGFSEEEALEIMYKDTLARISDFLEKVEYGRKTFEYEGERILIEKNEIMKIFRMFCEKEEVRRERISPQYRNYLVSENILFYNPVENIVKPQSRLIHRTIKKLVCG